MASEFNNIFNISKVVRGSFCQSSQVFGESAGLQCAAMSLVSVCWLEIKTIVRWSKYDLDDILKLGDQVFKDIAKLIGNFRILGVDDLPPTVNFFGNTADIKYQNILTGEVVQGAFLDSFTSLLSRTQGPYTGCLLFIEGYTFGVSFREYTCYLFDSHSRDSNGRICSEGTSVLLKFDTIQSLQDYISNLYCAESSVRSVYFQLQPIQIQISPDIKNVIYSTIRSARRNQAQHKRRAKNDPDSIITKKRYTEADLQRYYENPHPVQNAALKRYSENPTPIKNAALKRYSENPTPIKKAALKRYSENPTPIKNAALKRYSENPIPIKNAALKRYSENPTPIKNAALKRYSENPTPIKNAALKRYSENPTPIKNAALKRYSENFVPILQAAKSTYAKNPAPYKKASSNNYVKNFEKKKKTSRKRYKENAARKKCSDNLKPDKKKYASRIEKFLKQVWEGPVYICVVCNRSMYLRSVIKLSLNKYDLSYHQYFTNVISFDLNRYICNTCHLRVKKKNVPCQSVSNKLVIFPLPLEFTTLRRLETVLVARRILFKKIAIMHGKGEFSKIKGTICNVPVDSDAVCNVLPRGADNNGITLIKLKRQLKYRGHVQYEPVRPNIVLSFLNYLKGNNFLYQDIEIDPSKLNADCFDILTNNLDKPIQVIVEESCNEVDPTDPLDNLRLSASEMALISTVPNVFVDDNLIIAPGEGQHPITLVGDEFCEELAHPHLFPSGQYGYKVKREIPLSPVKYFNQRLLNYTQKFASDSDYIFFVRSVLQQLHLQNSINIALQKITSTSLTAGSLNSNYNQTLKSVFAQNNAFSFMSSVKGTPAYWKQFLYEVLAMVKQLGLPSYFLTLSCADLWWNELPSHINKLNNLGLSEEEIINLSYKDRCAYLNQNHVFLARHFQFRTQVFFKELILDGLLGKTKYYAYRVEFQARGSPHIHAFLWIKDFPTLTKDTSNEYLVFLDQIVLTSLPDPISSPVLYQFVKTFQIHHHSKTCWKYKNSSCRFHFGKFFTDQSIVAKPLSEELDEDSKQVVLKWRKELLDKVKSYIDVELNPSKKNIIDPSQDDYEEPKQSSDILADLGIVEEDYYKALSISKDNDFEIHFKRKPNSCFVNNYFEEGLMAWQANIDIQPVFNHYKAVTYMCSYFSKSEDECSEAMKQAAQEAFESNLDNYQQMKNVARAYTTKRECSIQEAVYHCLPELHLRRVFPKVVFANSNLPDERYKILKSKKDIQELPSDSKDIYKKNNLDRYVDRPNLSFCKGKYAALDSFCYAEFLGHYELVSKQADDSSGEYQPDVLPDDLIEINHGNINFPKKILLMNSKEKLRLRKVRKVVRYHIPKSKEVDPERYAHHLLMLFYPFRNETQLLSGNPLSYCSKLEEPGVINTINEKKESFEPYAELVETALNFYREDMQPSFDAEGQIENNENEETNLESDDELRTTTDVNTRINDSLLSSAFPDILPDGEICQKINCLNKKQRHLFDVVLNWARSYVKNRSCKDKILTSQIHIFLSGSGGVGKSHLIKTIYQSVSKTLLHHAINPEKPRVLLLAPTGVAAINIEGTTIHSGLGISPNNKIQSLQDKRRCDLRNKFSEVKLIIIDEISMVSSKLFYQVHQRLIQIFGNKDDSPFGGLSVIICGDLYQLPPVQGRPIYSNKHQSMEDLLIYDLWKKFKFIELTQVMRQNNAEFASLLNRVRIGEITDIDIITLKERFVKDSEYYNLKNIIHIFAENKPVHAHNLTMLMNINEQLHTIDAIDKIPTETQIPNALIIAAQNRKQQATGGLASKLDLKIGARVMLTVNIDVSDKLVNGLVGTVQNFKFVQGSIKVIYIKFDCVTAGLNKMKSDQFSITNKLVPIEKCETQIKIHQYKATSPVIKRTQFPLSLSWACTVHKVQGLSIPEGVISFTLHKQRSFNQGQMYVALSRVTTLEGLHLTGEFNQKAIKVNKGAEEEYRNMTMQRPLKILEGLPMTDRSLTLVLSNVRSFFKHAKDIFNDSVISDSDVICLTETGLKPGQNTQEIEKMNSEFKILYNNVENKECSLASLFQNHIVLTNSIHQPSISILQFQKPSFSAKKFNIALLYRKCNSSVVNFRRHLSDLVTSTVTLDIILGDFNVNFFDDQNNVLNDILSEYKQVVCQPTHLQGSLLDHIYVRKSLFIDFDYEVIIRSIFYSDHDAIKLKIQLKTLIDFQLEQI